MFRQVLVAVDGVDDAAALIRVAAGAAGRLDAGLLLWGVLRPGENRHELEQHLHELLRNEARGCGAFMAVASADPVQALLDHTEQAPGTLVCVLAEERNAGAPQGSTGFATAWLRRSNAPTLVIGPQLARSGGAMSWQRMVACVDASDRGERALETASDFARSSGLELLVAQAVCTGDGVFDRRRTRHYVDALAQSVYPPAAAIVLDAVEGPARALYTETNAMDGAILAVAPHGRSGCGAPGAANGRLGSVTGELIRNSVGPVLVIPEPCPFAFAGPHRPGSVMW